MGRYSKLTDQGKSLVDVASVLIMVGCIAMFVIWLLVSK